MYKIIELSKNYLFCYICGKCYIYKGSYEKHKLICNKNEINILDCEIISEENDIDYKNENRVKINYKILSNREMMELICPFYLFFCSLFFGFIKMIFYEYWQ